MSINEKLKNSMNDQLFKAILSLTTLEECYAFFEDICTVNELKSLSQRLHVAHMLQAGESYDEIVEQTGASTATISRVKRSLLYGADGYQLVLDRIEEKSIR
ncbi:YerC/YecD family TrpR-related protein [Veillonella montpellierensis]|uniref:YerC/YecD family TrpR-related protein n=1 Tax=Veillonella montpellierensis TaxID=187328 RepID=UPI0023F932EE|nr:YerC/YecD family TrpR-related protein [Veillonella montpellierensis]